MKHTKLNMTCVVMNKARPNDPIVDIKQCPPYSASRERSPLLLFQNFQASKLIRACTGFKNRVRCLIISCIFPPMRFNYCFGPAK